MSFCRSCGASAGNGRFCPKCGSKVEMNISTYAATPLAKKNDVSKYKLIAIISGIIAAVATIVAFIAVVIVVVMLLGGSRGAEAKLAGTWELEDGGGMGSILEIFSDGTYDSNKSNYHGGYSADGKRIRFSGVLVDDEVYYYKLKGDRLTLYRNADMEKESAVYERID